MTNAIVSDELSRKRKRMETASSAPVVVDAADTSRDSIESGDETLTDDDDLGEKRLSGIAVSKKARKDVSKGKRSGTGVASLPPLDKGGRKVEKVAKKKSEASALKKSKPAHKKARSDKPPKTENDGGQQGGGAFRVQYDNVFSR